MVFLTAATGLRVSEALGLKWSDVDFITKTTNFSRAVVHQHVGEMKTEISQRPVPMDGALAASLVEWSGQTPYRGPEHWVFASPRMNGKQPKKIGWHTFRRTLATLLTDSDENAKTTELSIEK
jgi:integrase